jgi:hypothetical protein
MRSKNGQFSKGFTGNPNGRPKRAEESFLIDLWESDGQRVFSDEVKSGKQWAIKMLIDKLYPNKKEGFYEVEIQEESKPRFTKEEIDRLLDFVN